MLKPRFNNKFGKAIRIGFENENATLTNFLAIYKHFEDPETSETSILWSGMCGDQTSWNTTDCPEQESGVVNFGVKDPYQGSDGYFPLNTGKYKVCLMDGDDVPYDVLKCKIFKVKSIKKYIADTKVTLTKTSFGYDEPIGAETFAPARVPNTWVGIYNASSIVDGMTELPDEGPWTPWYWIYAACNNQVGNQPESEYCSLRKKKNDISLEAETQDSYYGYWPVDPGAYVLCLSYFMNPPYRMFSCSEEFMVGMD